MTFGARTFQGMPQGAVVAAFNAGLSNVALTTGIRSATFTLVSDGTSTKTPTGGGTTVAGANWFSPAPTAGIGGSYYCKLVLGTNSGTTVSGSGLGVVSVSGASWTFTNTSTTTEGTGVATLNFYADAGGTQLVATGSVSWDVGYAP